MRSILPKNGTIVSWFPGQFLSLLSLAIAAIAGGTPALEEAREPSPKLAESAEQPTPDSAKELTGLSLAELASVEVGTVYGASKHEQTLAEAPSAVSIVTSDDIKKYGYRTLADILRSVRGFYVTSDRVYSYIGVRGVNRPGDFGGRVLITINGHRINEPIYDQAFNGTEFPLDVDLIDRVEVIRGPGSSLYGNNAFFTVINVITRTGKDLRGTELSGAVASYDTYSGRVSYGNHFKNGIDLLASGTWWESEGRDRLYYPEFRDVNQGDADHLDSSRAPSAWASLSYSDFTLEGAYADRRKDIPEAPYGLLFNVRPTWQEDERSYVGVRFEHDFENDWQLSARLYYDYYRSILLGPYDGEDVGLPGETVFNKDIGAADWLNGEAQLSKTFFEKHRLTFGMEFRHDLQLHQYSFNVAPYEETSSVKSRNDNVGLYLQDEFAIRTNLILNAGVRYDYFESFGDTINPRVALIYSPIERTTLKAIYGQAFRAPNAYESDYSFPGYLPNPNLQPEQIRSYELVWEQRLGEHLRFTTDLFYNQINDLITQVYEEQSDSYIFRNTDSVDARGFELELDGRWASGLRGYASYSFTDAFQQSAGSTATDLQNSPQHLGKVGVSVPLWRQKIFCSLEAQALSRRLTRASAVPGYVTCNVTLFSCEIVRGLEASISIYNLLDERYRDPVAPDFAQDSVEQDGRSFRAKLTYRF